jgi:hypothetical protein
MTVICATSGVIEMPPAAEIIAERRRVGASIG